MNFDEVWDRVCSYTGWHRYGEMAELLKVTASTISGAKGRGTFPIEWAFKIAQGYGLSTDWILTGEGNISRETGSNAGSDPTRNFETLENVIKSVEEIFQANDLYLTPEKKAKLVVFAYRHISQTNAAPKEVKSTILDLLDLTA